MTRELIVDFHPILRAVASMRSAKCRKLVLRQLGKDPDFKRCLQELAKNVVSGVVPLTANDKKRLNRQQKIVRKLTRQKSVSQAGGFLNIVVPLLATIVGELIAARR